MTEMSASYAWMTSIMGTGSSPAIALLLPATWRRVVVAKLAGAPVVLPGEDSLGPVLLLPRLGGGVEDAEMVALEGRGGGWMGG
jgi:hypothetical protein